MTIASLPYGAEFIGFSGVFFFRFSEKMVKIVVFSEKALEIEGLVRYTIID